jgi:hypothetical protein
MKVRASGMAVAKYDPNGASGLTFAQMFPPAPVPPGVAKDAQIAMDNAMTPMFGFAGQFNYYGEGVVWPGFPYLAELTQRPEYRMITEVRAKEMTRKGFELTYSGEDEAAAEKKMAELDNACAEFKVIDVLRIAAEHDGFFGGAQVYIDLGNESDTAELSKPLVIDAAKIQKGNLKGFKNIEPMWIYPANYNSADPLAPHFFKPQQWYVMGKTVHASRLLTMISREMPDILKPAYSFRGLSLSQMAKPYVDNWLRTRQSVSDLLHSFSIIVLASNLQAQVQNGADWATIYARVDEFNALRDNRGAFVLDKETEEMVNLAVPLGTLDALQAQAQEQMASISQTPLVKLLGITPSGLNACLTGDALILTDRGQVPIRDVALSDQVMTREGFAPLTFSGITKHATELVEIKTAGSTIRCTDNHPIWVASIGEFVRAENVRPGDRLLLIGERPDTQKTRHRWHGADNGGGSVRTATTLHGMLYQNGRSSCTEKFGKCIAGLFQMDFTSIISTKIRATISSTILSRCARLITPLITTLSATFDIVERMVLSPCAASSAESSSLFKSFRAGRSFARTNAYSPTGELTAFHRSDHDQCASAKAVGHPSAPFDETQSFARENAQPRAGTARNTAGYIIVRTLKNIRRANETKDAPRPVEFRNNVRDVVSILFQIGASLSFTALNLAKTAQGKDDIGNVISVRFIPADEPVYDLTVVDGYLPEFFANGILVHNSSDGEIRVFYDTIHALQEHLFTASLKTMLECLQLHLWGKVDPAIGHRWVELWQLDEAGAAAAKKTEADTDAVYIQEGVIGADEVRQKLVSDKNSRYAGLDPDDLPEPPEDDFEESIGGGEAKGEPQKEQRSGV